MRSVIQTWGAKMSRCFDVLQPAARGELGGGPLQPPGIDGSQHHTFEPARLADEETTRLVQRLFILPNSNAPKAVVFSSVQGDESDGICLRAGAALATQRTGSVCLVDGNLSAPSLHRMLHIRLIPGLLDAALNSGPITEFVVRLADNLWALPSGSSNSKTQRALVSVWMRMRLMELRRQFDYVLINAPPLHSCADAALLGQMADGVILIVEANSTRRENARIAKETLESANVRVLGAILNNRVFPIPESLYRKL
jgi:Mrp family chromosome partitioning ATPase